MKAKFFISFFCLFSFLNIHSKAVEVADTITNWQVYLNDQLISGDNIRYLIDRGRILSINQTLASTDTLHINFYECFGFDADCTVDIFSEKEKNIYTTSWQNKSWIQISIPVKYFYNKLLEVNQFTIKLSYFYQREHQGELISFNPSFDLLKIVLQD